MPNPLCSGASPPTLPCTGGPPAAEFRTSSASITRRSRRAALSPRWGRSLARRSRMRAVAGAMAGGWSGGRAGRPAGDTHVDGWEQAGRARTAAERQAAGGLPAARAVAAQAGGSGREAARRAHRRTAGGVQADSGWTGSGEAARGRRAGTAAGVGGGSLAGRARQGQRVDGARCTGGQWAAAGTATLAADNGRSASGLATAGGHPHPKKA